MQAPIPVTSCNWGMGDKRGPLPPGRQSGGGIWRVPPACWAGEVLRRTTCPCLSPFPSCHLSTRAQRRACPSCSAPQRRWHLAVSAAMQRQKSEVLFMLHKSASMALYSALNNHKSDMLQLRTNYNDTASSSTLYRQVKAERHQVIDVNFQPTIEVLQDRRKAPGNGTERAN